VRQLGHGRTEKDARSFGAPSDARWSRFGHWFVLLSGLALWACAGAAAPAAATPTAGSGQMDDVSARAEERTEAAAGSADDERESLFLSVFPLDSSVRVGGVAAASKDNEQFARALRVRLHVMRGYDDLGELTRRAGVPLVNGVFQLTDLSHLGSRDRPRKSNKQSSFVVDFDEAAVATAASSLAERHADPSADQVVEFVSDYIERKTYQRAFDIASRVAETKSGDCTEHAVLTAALLRRFGYSARIVLGLVLLAVVEPEGEPRVMAVGHAWVEYHDRKQWLIADAALRPDDDVAEERTGAPGVGKAPDVRLVYLPITVMKDESVAFGRALMDEVGVESVLRVELDAVGQP